MKVIGIIPARYQSTRFPGKPLVMIAGKTMIRRVYEQAIQVRSFSDVIVATDDERIAEEVRNFGGKVEMTSGHHRNGTERCQEVASKLDAEVIVNVQGDEPFADPIQLDLLSRAFEDPSVRIATLVMPLADPQDLLNPARIKVVRDLSGNALYFSRSPIPFNREATSSPVYYKHIGIYAYRKDVLNALVNLPPTPLEIAESLEQLRWLEHGYAIRCLETDHDSISVDVPADLDIVNRYLENREP